MPFLVLQESIGNRLHLLRTGAGIGSGAASAVPREEFFRRAGRSTLRS